MSYLCLNVAETAHMGAFCETKVELVSLCSQVD